MLKEKNLLKVFGIEKPKKDQLFRIMWVEKDSTTPGANARPLKGAEELLAEVLSSTFYLLLDGKIPHSNAPFTRNGKSSKPTTELRNSYIIPVEE